MFLFLVANVLLALNAGLVHNAAIVQEFSSSSCSKMAESASSSFRSMGSGISGAVEQFEQSSSFEAAAESESYKAVHNGGSQIIESSSSSQQYAARSMESYSSSSSLLGCSDVSPLIKIINDCEYITDKDYYIRFLDQCQPEEIEIIRDLIEYLNRKEQCLGDIDYILYKQKMQSMIELLQTNQFFDLNCDYTTKQRILQQIQRDLEALLVDMSEESILYSPFNYICRGNNYKLIPFICGMTNYLIEAQNSFYSTSSSSCSETRSVSSSSTSVSSCQIQPLIPILEQCEYITDKEYYLNYLNRCQSEDLEYISDLINHLNRKEQCLEGIEYTIFEEKMRSIYDILLKNQLYDVNCDLTTKQEILLQARQQLRQLLSTIPQNSFLYRPLNYICQDNNNQLFPLICGLTNSLCESQRTFYSTTTRSSSTNVSSHGSRSVSTSQTESTTTTVSETEIQPYIEMINQCQYFNTNRDYYLKFLQQCQSEDLEYIVPLLQLLNKREKCLGDFDLIAYQPKIKAIYDILETNQCFDLNYDFAAKQQIFQEAQQQLRLLLNNLPRDSVLYNPLKCLCEGDNYRLFPFLFGTTYGLFESQYSYYSSTSSSSSSCTSSSTSSCGGGSSCTESVQIESQSVQKQESSRAARSVCGC